MDKGDVEVIMVKIDIISGFLGAGKTTLIKKLLQDAFKGQQVVLIENESVSYTHLTLPTTSRV